MVTNSSGNAEGTFVGLRVVEGKLCKLVLVEKGNPDGGEEINLNAIQKGVDWEGWYNDEGYEEMVSNFLDGSPAFDEWWEAHKEMMGVYYENLIAFNKGEEG